jgi:V8-like Glu-specific endopeptidase
MAYLTPKSFLLVSITALVLACGNSNEITPATIATAQGTRRLNDPDAQEKIIGSNELTPVVATGSNIPEKYRSLVNAFGMMNMGCTATHIGDGLALSAGHCFRATKERQNNIPCGNVSIAWGVMKDAPAYLTTKCVTILAMEWSSERDYAIFTLSGFPSASVEVDLSSRPRQNTAITIFGFPQKRPLEWSQTCIVGSSAEGGYGADQFSHQCDTEPGNSGSTVLDDNTLKVVGIHDGGKVPWNYATYLINTPLGQILANRSAQ